MKKLYKIKNWYSLEDAAKRLTVTLGEDVSVNDVLQLTIEGHLPLSWYMRHISEEENLNSARLKPIIDDYLFTGHTPSRENIYDSIEKDKQPKILERKTVTERIIHKIKNFIKTFEDDTGDLDNA